MEPDTTTQDEILEKQHQERLRRISAMERFVARLTTDDLVSITPISEKIQFKHVHKSMKKKGGSPPKDYTAVEIKCDLEIALKTNNYEEALPLYYTLKRMLGYYNW